MELVFLVLLWAYDYYVCMFIATASTSLFLLLLPRGLSKSVFLGMPWTCAVRMRSCCVYCEELLYKSTGFLLSC